MQVFNLPNEVEEWLTIQFVIIFIIGFMINVYGNGQATLIFLENEYGVSPGDSFPSVDDKLFYIEKYSSDTLKKNNVAWFLSKFFYFFLSPLINYYYAFYGFRNVEWD